MSPVQHLQALVEVPEPAQPDAYALDPVRHGKFSFTSQGLLVDGSPSFEDWAQAMHTVAVMERGLAFLVGDLIRFGEERFGEMAAQVIDARSWRPETVRAYCWLAEKVPMENRMLDRGLTVKHHLAVAALPATDQRKWLRRALGDGEEQWTVARLQLAVRNGADVEPSRFYVLVECPTRKKRDDLQKQMEMDGHSCRAVDKR
jgi:hypothetical protein